MSKKIKFTIFIDKNGYKPFLLLLDSITNTYNKNDYSIYLGVDDWIFNEYKKNNIFFEDNVIVRKISNLLTTLFNKSLLINNLSIFSFSKLLIFDIFPELIDENNIVYLDNDTFLNKKIPNRYLNKTKNFAFSNNLNTNTINSSHKFWEKQLIKYKFEWHVISHLLKKRMIFNSGVLIINNTFDYIRLKNRIIEMNSDKLDDQTLLNVWNISEILLIDDFNMNHQYNQGIVNDKIIILHFSGRVKPWSADFEWENNRGKLLEEYFYLETKIWRIFDK